ncbi:MAG: hypothetical protein V2A72_05740, partial [Candidatus Omnitrophota bacterium]
MRNVKLTIEYDGTRYNGWQVQRSPRTTRFARVRGRQLKTIQGEIERAIQLITHAKSTLYASGRTDSGVHAKAQVA